MSRRIVVGLLALLTAAGSACGDKRDGTSSAPTAATRASTTTAAPATMGAGLPATGPATGAVLGVVGVSFDHVLDVRSSPGGDQLLVATLPPLADHVVPTGRAEQIGTTVWFEVTINGTTGWAEAAFRGYLGTTTDTTSNVVAKLGAIPSAASMLELGRIVADTAASTEDPVSRVTVAVAPTEDDLGEVTYDVVGLPDDAVYGIRLHVFGTPGTSNLPVSALEVPTRFSLKTVESTLLCGRGVTGDGRCV